MPADILARAYSFGNSHATVTIIASGAIVLLAASYILGGSNGEKTAPPLLPEAIPFFTNSFQLVSDIRGLCARAG